MNRWCGRAVVVALLLTLVGCTATPTETPGPPPSTSAAQPTGWTPTPEMKDAIDPAKFDFTAPKRFTDAELADS